MCLDLQAAVTSRDPTGRAQPASSHKEKNQQANGHSRAASFKFGIPADEFLEYEGPGGSELAKCMSLTTRIATTSTLLYDEFVANESVMSIPRSEKN